MSGAMRIRISPSVKVSRREIVNSRLLCDWLGRCKAQGIEIRDVFVYAAHCWGSPSEVKMAYLEVDAWLNGRKLDGLVTLRGEAVDVLAHITTNANDYVVFVAQTRVPGMQSYVLSNPSGMIDPREDVRVAALRELNEETGINLAWSAPINMLGNMPLLVSPGFTDERVYFCVVRATATEEQVAQMNGRLAGVAAEGEHTKLYVVSFDQALALAENSSKGYADLKTLMSLMLYKARHNI
ncbi:MAG: NUDIX hydrolase [Candidatus Woesebacteria bacterium]|jgi:8-oxo-dGTP pyrophosphatase MutT (NUDIX family)